MNSFTGKIALFILTQVITLVLIPQTITPVKAQSITPANDGTGTVVTTNGNQLNITGGSLSQDGANLFQSFQKFGLSQGEIANFLSSPNIQNILGRIVGGDPSLINGIIQVTGGNSNLFLMNPAGILFGANASLNLPADFTATTANSIWLGENKFNAVGTNDYANLVGTPNTFYFSASQPGSIVNFANLAASNGKNLNLLGGTVLSTGNLSAPGGNITVASVPGENLLRISQPGHVLSLEVEPSSGTSPTPATLLDLLTGNISNADGVTINNGQVELTGSGMTVNAGDLVTNNVTALSATLSANKNLTSGFVNSTASNNTGKIDINAGGNISIGDASGASVLAVGSNGNGANITIKSSTGSILSSGTIQSESTNGNGGVISLSAFGDINTGSLRSLAIDPSSSGSGNAGNINVTSTNGSITNKGHINAVAQGNGQGGIVTLTSKGDITIDDYVATQSRGGIGGNINLTSQNGSISVNNPLGSIGTGSSFFLDSGTGLLTSFTSAIGGNVTLQAAGNISTGVITSAGTNSSGTIGINSTGGSVSINSLYSGSQPAQTVAGVTQPGIASTSGGNIAVSAENDITLGKVSTEGNSSNGNINLTTQNGSQNINGLIGKDVSITGNEINFGGGVDSIVGTGNLTLQTVTPDQNIAIAGTTDSGINTLDLIQSDITALANGFSSITIARNNSSGAIAINNPVEFKDATTIKSPTGNIAVNGKITGTDNASITLEAPTTNLKADITTNNQNINIIKDVLLGNNVNLNSGSGTITINGKIDGNNDLTINAGNINFGDEIGRPTKLGNLNITNTGTTTIPKNIFTTGDINISSSLINLTGTTNQELKSDGGKIALSGNLTAGNNDITLTADDIELPSTTTGQGNLTIQSATINRDITLGNDINGTLNLTSAELAGLADGFSSITIGRNDGTGKIAINNPVAFKDATTIKSPTDIAVNGKITGTDNASITLEAPTTNLKADITTNNQNINISKNVLLGNNVNLNSGSGTIAINGKIDGNKDLNITGGNINFSETIGDIDRLSNLKILGITNVAKNILTTGNISFNSPLNLIGSGAKIFSTDNGNITFSSTVNGNSGLTTSAQNGIVSFNDVVGGTTKLTSLTSIANQTLIGNNIFTTGDINISSNLINLTGTTNQELKSDSGKIALSGNLTAGNNDITLTADDIELPSTTTGQGNLTIQSATLSRDITLGSDINGTLNLTSAELAGLADGFSSITIGRNDGTGTIVVNNPVTFKDTITIKAPTTNLNADITTNNQNINISKDVLLGNNVNVNSGSGTITINGKIDGNKDLNLTGGNINFRDDIGNTTKINNLTILGTTNVSKNILTTGNITFNSPLNLIGSDAKLFSTDDGNIIFSSTVNGNSGLTTSAQNGIVSFNDVVGGTTKLISLTSTANQTLVGNDILTTGNISFNSRLNLIGSDAKLFSTDNGNITFSSTVNGNSGLTTSAQNGIVSFNDVVGGTTKLTSLTTTANQNLVGNNIFTTGDITISSSLINLTGTTNQELKSDSGKIAFSGNLTAGNNDITLTADDIELPSTTTGKGNLTIQSATVNRDITLGNDINGTLNLTSAELAGLADGFSSITIGRNDGTGKIVVNNPVTFKDATTIKSPNGTGSITSTSTIIGNASINLLANQNISTSNITTNNQNINITSTIGGINVNGAISGSSINLKANQNISTTNINGGNIDINSSLGGITNGDITGNLINITANQNITAGNISTTNNNVNLKSNTGVVTTQNITTQGGDINIEAKERIKTGILDSSSISGNAGNVTLDPDGDIEVISINTQAFGNGTGGNVDITTNRFFRATGTFSDRNGVNASISTLGTNGDGSVTIRHGGNGTTAFVVGNTDNIGTAGAITAGINNSIKPTRFYQGNYTQGNIQFITNSSINEIAKPSDETLNSILQSPAISNAVVTVDRDFAGLEERFTGQFDQISGQQVSRKSIAEAQTALGQIQTQTGIKPAIVYASFTPSGDTSTKDNDILDLVIVTSEGKPIHKQISSATRAKVMQVAQKFYGEISDINQANTKNYLASSQQLYQWLIAPQEAELQKQGIKNLAFVMDVGLRSIPIAALHDGKQFLIEKYSLGMLPSFSLTNTSYSSIKKSQVLAMGASEFTKDQKQQPLLAVPIELDNIAKLWNGKSFVNQSFTLENIKIKRQENPFGMIHLATHVDFVSGDSRNSYIQLYNSKLGLDKVRELGWNKPPVELLILSACKSAFGDEKAELGFAGLAVQTGVKSAVASLWYVSDAGTLGLMTEFYRQLKTAPIKAEALQKAQLAMIRGEVAVTGNKLTGINSSIDLPPAIATYLKKNINGDLSHPYYWSAFTMIGSQW